MRWLKFCRITIWSERVVVPVYVYRRRDGSSFELAQPIAMDALAICPTTGQSVDRVMQPFSAHFSGSGFYSTDHREPTPPKSRPDRGGS